MALLTFNSYLDRWKQKFLQFAGDAQFRDHLSRAGLSYQDFKLTAAQMDTLNATPVALLAAPGAGLVYLVERIYTIIQSTGFTAFELGSGTLDYKYTDGSGVKVVTSVPNATVESATDTAYNSDAADGVPAANAAVVAYASADVTAGTGAVYGRIWYRTVKVAEVGVRTELT